MTHARTGFRPGWKLSLFTVLLLPALLSLGFWQLAREEEKRALQAAWDARRALAPTTVAALDPGAQDPAADLQYLPVALRGRYDQERAFLLDNRVYRGRAGYELISPFLMEDGRTALVNRGWLPPGSDRSDLPAIPPIEGEVLLAGSVHVPGDAVMLGAEEPFAGWPRVIQEADTARMHKELATEDGGFPYVIRLAEGQPGALARDWPVVTTAPEKHRAYAVQWFAMAAVLLGLFVHAGLRRRESE